MTKRTIRISDAALANNLALLLEYVRAGFEIIIEHDSRPVAIVRPAEPSVRLLSESLRLAREHGSSATLDGGFASDLNAIIASRREPVNPPERD
jgi:prevent-host-death family protein